MVNSVHHFSNVLNSVLVEHLSWRFIFEATSLLPWRTSIAVISCLILGDGSETQSENVIFSLHQHISRF